MRSCSEERYAKRLPMREQHSKLGAFWHTEVGPLNQVIHVYPYDDLRYSMGGPKPLRRGSSSPLAACWTSDIGGLNKFAHTWVYKDLNERARIREATRKADV